MATSDSRLTKGNKIVGNKQTSAAVVVSKEQQNESGFYCDVCDCIVKDSLNYLDHINGKRHNKNLGISLKKFTDCSLEEVREMLELKKRERDERESGFIYKEENDEEIRQRKRDKKKRQRARRIGIESTRNNQGQNQVEEEEDQEYDTGDEDNEDHKMEISNEPDDEMARIMGFANFSSSKR